MIEEKLRALLSAALSRAMEKGQLQMDELPALSLEIPKEKGHGDLSSNAAMMLGKKLKVPPSLVAETIIQNLPQGNAIIEKVEIAGPGFLNFFLNPAALHEDLNEISTDLDKKKSGKTKEKILLEFVSANPTGPLNVVNARAAAVGDTLARLLQACDFQVDCEYYINNEGTQIENFARSVEARYLELQGKPAKEFPENWYTGEYVKTLAAALRDGFKDITNFETEGKRVYGDKIFTAPRLKLLQTGFGGELLSKIPDEPERLRFLTAASVTFMVNWQRTVLKRFNVVFQSWYFQSQLGNRLQKTIDDLKAREHLYEKEGALWFRTTAFKDDKDRVLVRKDGQPTYFAADIAYHAYKKERGYERLIDFVGPDHHGYIARAKACIQALGYSADSFEIYLIQLVTLMSGGKPFRMSKRAGEFITMDELLDEVGVDAARWYFLSRHRDSHLEFDVELAKMQSDENPLYYVQYAHARICSILKAGEEQGIRVDSRHPADLSLLTHDAEKELIKKMTQWKSVVELAAANREPHHLPRYAMELARSFHSFYTACRVLGGPSEQPLSLARLFLIATTRRVLAKILALMGISAPEKM